jgi:hemerythrin superfamily protein
MGPATEYTRHKEEPVKATRLLKQDHDEVRGLFRQLESAGEKAHNQKQRIVEQVFRELQAHTQIEEEIFYPAFKAATGDEGEEMVGESLQEHHVVDVLMEEMQALEPDNPEWEAKFTVLMENVEHHAEEEEKEMFPKAEKTLADQLDDLGAQMEQRKNALMASAR